MLHRYQLGLSPDVTLSADGPGLVLGDLCGRRIRLPTVTDEMRALIDRLGAAPASDDDLAGGDPQLHYLLLRLDSRGLLSRTVAGPGWSARLDPAAPGFRFEQAPAEGAFRLSRFAVLRRAGDETVLECPLGLGRVAVEGGPALAMIGLLATAQTAEALSATLAEVDLPQALAFVGLLAAAGAAFACDAEGRLPEDTDPALRQWEFHDLLFHSRTRYGRHDQPLGGTFRFEGQIPHAPVLKPPMSATRIALPAPDLGSEPLQSVLERRRSRDDRGPAPMSLDTLGAFLRHTARVQTMAGGERYQMSFRPTPSGGAVHSLELYLTVQRAAGLDNGLYHYAAGDHALERLGDLDGPVQALLDRAGMAAGLTEPPDILITLASRFARTAWKYEGIAYALTLKEAGALIQQMYLIATALGLAPRTIGCGDIVQFAEVTGLPFHEEGAVAEFLLSAP